MVKTNRRTTVMGLGALALGSGAVFTSAAFQSSVTPDADFRVVVDERLLVQAGAAFRGGDPTGDFTLSDPVGPDASKLIAADGSERPIFDNNPGLDGFVGNDLPLMSVNGRNNEDLEIENAVLLPDESTVFNFRNSLQINSQSDTSVVIGIEIEEYGDNVDDVTDITAGVVSKARVRDIYKFWLNHEPNEVYNDFTDDSQISSSGDDDTTQHEQGSPFQVNETDLSNPIVNPGDIHQMRLAVDLDSDDISKIMGVAGDESSGTFDDDAFNDIDLVDVIRVGVVERNANQ